MKIAVFLLLSFTLCITACAQRGKKTLSNTNNTTVKGTSGGTIKDKVAGGPSIAALRMDRTGCFGQCPIYYVKIADNGMTSFHGIRFTEYEGIWEKQLPAAECQALMRKFEVARVDTCAETYEMMVSDLPSVNYVFYYADKSAKNIQNATYGPQFLNTLSREVDALVRVDKTWKQTAKTATYD